MSSPSLSRRSFFKRSSFAAGSAALLAGHQAVANSVASDTTQQHLCTTCGVQFAETSGPPKECPVCQDDRQYVGQGGQQWTTLEAMKTAGLKNIFRELEPRVHAITTEPKFGIGQRAFLLQNPSGNLLWDCISLLDESTIKAVQKLGGISAIAISHPHYYSTMVEWSQAFGDVPIYLHEDDQRWVMRPDSRIRYWKGETLPLSDGMTVVRTGGHFAGYQVLHSPKGAEGRGVLFSGDQPQIAADPRWVSFMYSYPNMIPLNEKAISRIVTALEPYAFDRIYSAFSPGIVKADAKAVVQRSAQRYIRHISQD